MSKQVFSAIERQAIYEAYGGKCIYTGKLIDLRDMQLDHIIPEKLATRANEFNEIRQRLNLGPDFNIFGYENIVPSTSGSNLLKLGYLFDEQRMQLSRYSPCEKTGSDGVDGKTEKTNRYR